MKCRKIEKQLVNYYYRELNSEEIANIARHLAECVSCWQAYKQLRQTLEKVSGIVGEEEKTPAFWQQFQNKIFHKLEKPEKSGARLKGWWELFIPRRLVPVLAGALLTFVIIFTGVRVVHHGQDERLADLGMVQDLDLMADYDLIQNLELLENLPEVEQFRG